MKDYNYIYLGIEGEYELDKTVYDFSEDDMIIFPDYEEEEELGYNIVRQQGFNSSEVQINRYDGYFTDTLTKQCIVLVRAEERYPAGPIWGIPYSVLLLYRYNHGQWVLGYSTSYYDEVQLVQLDEKSKISLLYVNINYCNMGSCQWLEVIDGFDKEGINGLYYDIVSDESMDAEYPEDGDTTEFWETHSNGDTLGCVKQLDQFKDIDKDGIKEMILSEHLTILEMHAGAKPKNKSYIRHYTYKYKKGKFVLVSTTAFEDLTEPY